MDLPVDQAALEARVIEEFTRDRPAAVQVIDLADTTFAPAFRDSLYNEF